MKRFYTLALSLLALLMISTMVSANKVIVKGTVTNSGGPVANWALFISDSSSAASCKQTHTVYTNANGYYVDSFSCTGGDIRKLSIYTHDCNGAYLVHNVEVPVGGSNVVENNFIICGPTVTGCEAGFTFTREQNSQVVHYNSANAHGASTYDKIIRRRWKFADGDTLGGNVVDPSHTYPNKGSYQTCLTIWTAFGCENTVCQTVNIVDSTPHPVPPTVHCAAKFTSAIIASTSASSVYVKFNSTSSSVAPGDSIRERIWKFGDGSTASTVDPAHFYSKGGVYNVCLIIRSAGGCSDTACINILLPNPTPLVHCAAKFTFEAIPSTSGSGVYVKFNSASSSVAPGDSIRERIWKFGDGSTASTVDPAHFYSKGGVYNVCLIIRSKGGCSDTACVNIQLPVVTPPTCHSDFTFVPDGATVKFNSTASSSDSIVSKQWFFGDGSAIATTGDPSHKFEKSGVYTVCLYIKTAHGCESKECKQITVTVPSPPVTTRCAAVFTSSHVTPKKFTFSSSNSAAVTNDSITERLWSFGDGSAILGGNVISPSKEFARPGIYTVCLKIRTAKGCDNYYCSTVKIDDTTTTPVANTEAIKIVSLHPNPVVTPLSTEVWSKFNNVTAELSIYDIYGVKKWSLSKVLLQGTNVTSIPTSSLLPGPYFFRVTTMYGVKSAQFYKL